MEDSMIPVLLEKTAVTSLGPIFVCKDVKLLHTFCFNLRPEPITERLLSQCHFLTRLGNRPHFFIKARKRLDRTVS